MEQLKVAEMNEINEVMNNLDSEIENKEVKYY